MTLHETDAHHTETKLGRQRQHSHDRKMFWYWILAGFILAQLFFFKLGFLEPVLFLVAIIVYIRGDFLDVIIYTIGVLVCFYPVSIVFYAWTWRGTKKKYVSKHSIFLLLLLCITYPLQIVWYIERTTGIVDDRVLTYLDKYPNYFLFEFLDSFVLLCLCVWFVRRSQTIRPWDFLVFHFFLFVALIWATRILQTSPAGFFVLM